MKRAQVGPVLRVGVEVGLEVVDLGQHELVVGVAPGLVQVQRDQLERGAHLRQAAVLAGQQQPGLGELALGVPPDRVVVEVADHPHRPARLGDGQHGVAFGTRAGGLGDGRHRQDAARAVRGGDGDRDLGRAGGAGLQAIDAQRIGRGDPRTLDADDDGAGLSRCRVTVPAQQRHPHDLQRAAAVPANSAVGSAPVDTHDLIVARWPGRDAARGGRGRGMRRGRRGERGGSAAPGRAEKSPPGPCQKNCFERSVSKHVF